jgi:hypothetical protein
MAQAVSTPIAQLIASTDRTILESPALLQLIYTYPSPQAPDYLDQLLSQLNLHVNFIYGDPLYTLLTSLRDSLLRIGEVRDEVVEIPQVVKKLLPSDGLELDTDLYTSPRSPRTILSQLILYTSPPLSNQTQVQWNTPRPPELGDTSYSQEDALLLMSPEVETILANGRQYISLLLKYGLNQERLNYADESEASRYLTVPLYLFKYAGSSRIRHYALDLMTQLFTLGLDPYTDVVIEALYGTIRDGAVKILDEVNDVPESLETNFDKVVELLTALFRVGFDINYQYMKVLTFSDEFGLPTHESNEEVRIEKVKYVGLSVLGLCAIYNRVDVIAWVLNFCGPLALDPSEETDLTSRTLDVDNTALNVEDLELQTDPKYLTLTLTLHKDPSTIPEQCDLLTVEEEEKMVDYTPLELAIRHRSHEAQQLLQDYQDYLYKNWNVFDPMTQDVRDIGYEI